MKPTVTNAMATAMTLMEVLVVLVVVALLAMVLLPALTRSKARSARVGCVSNLQQIGLSVRMWSNDHGYQFPGQVTVKDGGRLELGGSVEAFRHFSALSNELGSPKVLACPDDKTRTKVADWAQLNNSHISYFLALDADETRAQRMLAGDRSISTNGAFLSGFVILRSNSPIRIAKGIHLDCANVGLSDGSAQQFSTRALQAHLRSLEARMVFP
jgi:competence protein ComGC